MSYQKLLQLMIDPILAALLLGACGAPVATPAEQQVVTLKALPGRTDVPIYRHAWMMPDDVIARLPSGTDCTLLAKETCDVGHGVQTKTVYKVNCSGAIGYVDEESLDCRIEESLLR